MTLNDARIILGGSACDLRELDDSLDCIARHLSERAAPPLAVTSINLDHVHHFGSGAEWTGALDADGPVPGAGAGDLDWLNLIDGAPLAAQAKRLTGRAWPRLAGSDLIEPILRMCESRGTRIGFLGGAASTHGRVLTELAARYPTLRVSGLWAPSREDLRDPVRSEEIAREIRAADTELLIVGLGKPRQELWIAEHGVATGARVLLAFGAVVDFLAGRVSRAPQWMCSHGLEWAWRLALEPRRLFTRYLVQGPPAYLAVRRTRDAHTVPVPIRFPVVGVPADRLPEPRFAGPDEHADVAVVVVAGAPAGLSPLLDSLRGQCQDLRLRCIVAGTGLTPAPWPHPMPAPDVIRVPGLAARCHAGAIDAARPHLGDADAVLVLDGAVILEPGALRAMVDRMNRVGAGAVIPRLLHADGTPVHHLRREPTLARALRDATIDVLETDPDSYEHAHQVRWGVDTCLLVRRDVADTLCDRDDGQPTGSAEPDYVLRVRESGAAIWFEPTARIRCEPRPTEHTPTLAALLTAHRVRFTRSHHSLAYTLAFQAAVAVTAARHLSDPTQRRILRALLPGGAERAAGAVSPAAAQTAAITPERWGNSVGPAGAIIIPAHNEHATIGRTLAGIAPMAAANQAEIIVVCNGCSDTTAAIARSFPGVAVHEIDTASKTAALNVGDATAGCWPRLYLDADVGIEPATVRAIFHTLSSGPLLAARPVCAYDSTGASAPVRAYYRARARLPTNRAALWGAGAYAVNAAGHARIGRFPAVTADDSFVDALFDASEKVVVPARAPVRVYTPRTVSGLVNVIARQSRGVTELGAASTTLGSVTALLRSVRGPASATDALCYGVLTALGRLKTHQSRGRGVVVWERDLSSRSAPPDLAA